MSTQFKSNMKQVMNDAWRIFKVTGISFAECLKRAWAILKLKTMMKYQTVQFYYQKVNGEIRQAFGTMRVEIITDKIKNNIRKKNDDLLTYWDTEKQSFRSFKKFNLIKIA